MPEKGGRAEKAYWRRARADFKRRFPEAALQRDTVEKIAKQLIPLLNQWKKAKKNAANSWQQLENYLLNTPPEKTNQKRFKRLLDSAQMRSIRAIGNEQSFFEARETLKRYLMGITDFEAQQTTAALEYGKFSIVVEKEFYGNIRRLADTRLLKAFADRIARMNISKDVRYNVLRQNVSDLLKASEYTNRGINEYLGNLRYAYDFGHIKRERYYVNLLMSEITITQHAGNIAEAEESLYSYLRRYAKNARLSLFLATLARERKAERGHFAKKEKNLIAEISKFKGAY